MPKAFNRFTITCGDRVISVHNEAFDVSAALTDGEPFGKYIVVGREGATATSEREMSSEVCVLETTLAEYNTDFSKGKAFAAFTARLDDEAAADGEKIGAVGLSHFFKGFPLVDFASFPAVTKRKGEDIVVRAEIVLRTDGDAFKFTSGDNKLARVLLGIDGLGSSTFELGVGGNYHGNKVMPRGTGDISARVSVTPVITDGGIKFSGAFTAPPYELLLLMDGVAVMRGFVPTGAHVEQCTATLRENRSAEIAGKHVSGVLNIKSSSVAVGNEYDFPKASKLTADCPQIVQGKLGKNVELMSETTGAHFAIKTDKEITVYKATGGTFTPLYKVGNPGGKTELLGDGGLMNANGRLNRYKIGSDGSVRRITYGGITEATDVATVLDSSGKARFIVINGGAVSYRNETADGVTTSVSIGAVADDSIIGRMGKSTVYYASNSTHIIVAYCGGARNSAYETQLRAVVTNQSFQLTERRDQWARLHPVHTVTMEYVIPLAATSSRYFVSIDEKTIFCGNYCMAFKDGKLVRCYQFKTSAKLAVELMNFDEGIAEPEDAIVAGDYILALYADGSVKTLYPVPYGRVIYCPDLEPGTSITFDAIVVDDPMSDASSVNAEITLAR